MNNKIWTMKHAIPYIYILTWYNIKYIYITKYDLWNLKSKYIYTENMYIRYMMYDKYIYK
jgi:hypothetical protein